MPIARQKHARAEKQAKQSKKIAENLNLHVNTVGKWCKGIKPPSPVESEILDLLRDGKVWKTSDIVAHSRFARRNVMTALKKLVETDAIFLIKRGHYQNSL